MHGRRHRCVHEEARGCKRAHGCTSRVREEQEEQEEQEEEVIEVIEVIDATFVSSVTTCIPRSHTYNQRSQTI